MALRVNLREQHLPLADDAVERGHRHVDRACGLRGCRPRRLAQHILLRAARSVFCDPKRRVAHTVRHGRAHERDAIPHLLLRVGNVRLDRLAFHGRRLERENRKAFVRES